RERGVGRLRGGGRGVGGGGLVVFDLPDRRPGVGGVVLAVAQVDRVGKNVARVRAGRPAVGGGGIDHDGPTAGHRDVPRRGDVEGVIVLRIQDEDAGAGGALAAPPPPPPP